MDDKEPLALYVYKTMTDPFAGRISFFKVVSGVVKNDMTVENFTRQEPERLCASFGHAGTEGGGDAGAACGRSGCGAKAAVTLTGDTLGDRAHEIFLEPVRCPSR